MIDKTNELQSRHWDQIDVSALDKVKSKLPEVTKGQIYEAQKAQEDEWQE